MYSKGNSTIRPNYISVSYWLKPPQPIHDQLVLTKTIWKMHADGSPRASSPGCLGESTRALELPGRVCSQATPMSDLSHIPL